MLTPWSLIIWPAATKRSDIEEHWASFQPWLESQGYMLRPRYHAGWSLPYGTTPMESETANSTEGQGSVLDATRMSDGAQVVLKFVATDSTEANIWRFLRDDPGAQAHALPLLDLLRVDDKWSILVTPRMRTSDNPRFETVGEVVEFVQQVLEALEYMHKKGIARILFFQLHLNSSLPASDIHTDNIVMDTSRMIPSGFHFARPHTGLDGKELLLPYSGDEANPFHIKTRTQAAPVKYYFISFASAVQCASYWAPELVTGVCSSMGKHVPELSDTVPYNPFKLDMRLVGEMLRSELLLKYDSGLDFLVPLVRELRRREPVLRPSADLALALFQRTVFKMSPKQLAEPIREVLSLRQERKRRAMLFMKGL
ncbi:hypothetical protein B0H11DRAFT_2228387 [Mycena galericulata]|nr:hypothetical protein B0H11DRAFT_2228387 [Mycena galericulata]